MKYEKIMIVDDSRTSRMIIKRCFVIAGYENADYREAEDGLAALNILKEDSGIDLIVSDLNMPRMDGSTFVKRLNTQKDLSEIPVIIISSMANDAVREELDGSSVFAIIRKPFSPVKLSEILGEVDDEF